MQSGILAAAEPTEWRLLEAIRAMLAGATGSSYIYDASGAYVVPRPSMKHLAEVEDDGEWPRALYLVSPGDLSPQDYTQCATLFPGDCLVTGCVKVGSPELPWSAGHVEIPRVQLRIVQDIYKAVHLKQVGDAILKIANRNVDTEADGWAIVQVQIGFEFTEVDA